MGTVRLSMKFSKSACSSFENSHGFVAGTRISVDVLRMIEIDGGRWAQPTE
jgi:hypothetical protein